MDIAKQYCKGCQNNITLDNFTEGFKTCDRCRAKGLRRYYNNPDYYKEKRKEWNENNPEKVKEANDRARAKASEENGTVLYVNMKWSGVNNPNTKKEHFIRRMSENKLIQKIWKFKMNQTVNILMNKDANFIVTLPVDVLKFGLINGDHILGVRHINTTKQINYPSWISPYRTI